MCLPDAEQACSIGGLVVKPQHLISPTRSSTGCVSGSCLASSISNTFDMAMHSAHLCLLRYPLTEARNGICCASFETHSTHLRS